MNWLRAFLLASALLSVSAFAQFETDLRDAGSLGAIRLAGTDDPNLRKTYIVQLKAPSAADFHALRFGPTAKLNAPGQPRVRFDKASSAIQTYTTRLAIEQDKVLARAGAGTELIYRYQFGLNGFAARMHPSQAHKLENLPDVLRVWEDEIRPLATNFSLDFLGLFDPEKGLRGAPGLDGDGIVIGVIDSGITPEHPSLADTREADRPQICSGDWAENSILGRWLCRRFDKQEDTVLFEPPENWNGSCQSGDQFESTACNNKLIGARWFITGAEASGPIDDGEIRSARDADGHGTHTATIAAGNRVKASIFGSFIGRIEGVAPRARIAVYKACWLRPGDQRASCNTSDLANAIDAAVADGVDIINYSVGSSLLSVTAPDDLALMAATKAGVFTVVAAGNEGPNLGTIGSPAGAPWVLTAAASSRDGTTTLEALEIKTPPGLAGKYAAKEANFTPALSARGPLDGDLVLVDDGEDVFEDGSAGTLSDACEPLINSSDISNNIALIQRGGCDFDVKVANAADAGAIAAIVYNIAGDPVVMNGATGLSDIPAVMIGQADANLILAEFDAGNLVTVLLDKDLFLTENDTGNVMGSFSARGPGPVPDILKPDVTAPGINILAGFSPDAANAAPGENFAYLTGTSMSTPHVAGVAALLLQAHPDWSPSAIKSALMTTAHQSLTGSDGVTAALPFDYGAGHIVPNDSVDPGLVYDVSSDDYDAFACGIALPGVTQERCDQLSAAGYSFAGADLNQPSIAIERFTSERTVSRSVTNVSDQSASYVATVIAPVGIGVNVVPASITVAPGETATFDVTFSFESGPLDLWRFGSLTWSDGTRSVYSTIAIRPISVTAPAQVTDFGADGSLSFPVEFGYTGAYTAGVHGLRLPLVLNGFVDNDPTKTFSFRSDSGVTMHLIDVPVDEVYLRFSLFDTLTDGDDDLDMYVYYCPDNVNCTKLGDSGEASSQEEFNVLLPAAGRYAVLVHGFETDQVSGGPGANYSLLGWSFGLVDDQGNMTASGPAFVNAGSTENVTVTWTGLLPDTIYLGGISHNTPQGLSAITVIRIGN
ncbi:MAG: S8 family serine peptidase [Woeseiaceae bacterium]|nr:S8 family serine peptidase [Woeseiaceae bacterium]MDX2608357.1 S8 family serine peptidase [Woeseiaceae bacterium]